MLAACGTTELPEQVAFDDTWAVTELIVDDAPVDLTDQQIEIEIDTSEAAVRGRTNCQRLFGSYTLVGGDGSSGDASFTIPSPEASTECRDVDQAVHTDVVDALESVTQWSREGSELRLTSPSGTSLLLVSQPVENQGG